MAAIVSRAILAADRRLDRDLEQVARDQVLQTLAHARPRSSATARWTIMLSASTGSLLTRMLILTRSPSRRPICS
jgi:hypothetical protein